MVAMSGKFIIWGVHESQLGLYVLRIRIYVITSLALCDYAKSHFCYSVYPTVPTHMCAFLLKALIKPLVLASWLLTSPS